MIELVDTSMWIEFLRGTPTRASAYVEERLGRRRTPLAVTEPVLMEVLAGTSADNAGRVEGLLDSQVLLGVEPATDYHAAAELYRRTRVTGRTVRSLNDCLIAAVAMRHDVVLVHRDAEFTVIAEVTALREHTVGD